MFGSKKTDHRKICQNKSLSEVMEYTRNIDISDGLAILLEKIVDEIEDMKIKENKT